jgi:hypothetical protein
MAKRQDTIHKAQVRNHQSSDNGSRNAGGMPQSKARDNYTGA